MSSPRDSPRRSAPRRADAPAARRVPVGPRAGRALDRAAHRRGGLRARRRRAAPATTPSCSTSSATCSSRSTSCRCCSRSAAPGSLAAVAEHCRQKLIRRHPHVFGDVEVDDGRRGAAQLGRDQGAPRRAASPGSSARCPRTCPARCTRARSSAAPRRPGFDFDHVPYEAVRDELDELEAADAARGPLPRGRRRAVRGRRRRAQAEGRPRARAARGVRPLPRPRRGGGARSPHPTGATGTISIPRTQLRVLRPPSPLRVSPSQGAEP